MVLSEGYTLYFGPPARAMDWFSGTLGYTYNQARDGSISDWLMDLVSVGFGKPTDWAGRCAPRPVSACPPAWPGRWC